MTSGRNGGWYRERELYHKYCNWIMCSSAPSLLCETSMFTWLGDFELYSGFHTEEEMGGEEEEGELEVLGFPYPQSFPLPPEI